MRSLCSFSSCSSCSSCSSWFSCSRELRQQCKTFHSRKLACKWPLPRPWFHRQWFPCGSLSRGGSGIVYASGPPARVLGSSRSWFSMGLQSGLESVPQSGQPLVLRSGPQSEPQSEQPWAQQSEQPLVLRSEPQSEQPLVLRSEPQSEQPWAQQSGQQSQSGQPLVPQLELRSGLQSVQPQPAHHCNHVVT